MKSQQINIDLRGQVDSIDTLFGNERCNIMLRMPKPDSTQYRQILLSKWDHISEGTVRGTDTGCTSCRRRSATVTCDGLQHEFFLPQVSDFILTVVETYEKRSRSGQNNANYFFRHEEGSSCNQSYVHPGRDIR